MKKLIEKIAVIIIKSASNNKKPKRNFEGNKNRIDGERNKLRNDLIKILIKKSLFEKGQKFGDLVLNTNQQVTALIRVFKNHIREYVVNDLDALHCKGVLESQNYQTATRYPQFYTLHENDENGKYATINDITENTVNEMTELVITQHIDYFTDTLKGKVQGS